MSLEHSASRLPNVLIASGHEWVIRALEAILLPYNITVWTALTGRELLARARTSRADAVILDTSLPDISSLDLCRELRASASIGAQTPILLVVVSAPARRKERIDAFRAGAWGYYDLSLDSEELVLRLETYLQAKIAADQIREASLEDELTGLYSLQGLLRRLGEMGSDAFRHHRPLACLAIDSGSQTGSVAASDITTEFAELVRQSCRASDTIGRLPSNEFVVIAPNTDELGAERLAERIANTAEDKVTVETGASFLTIRIGLFAVSNFQGSQIEPADIITHARTALDLSRKSAPLRRIVRYSSVPSASG